MTIAKILVPLTGQERDRVALKTAIAMARPFNAHVSAIFVHLDPKFAYPYGVTPVSRVAIDDVIAAAEDYSVEAEKRARSAVSVVAWEEDVKQVSPDRKNNHVTISFKTVVGKFHDSVLKEAELCDLIVFGAINAQDEPEVSEAFLDALLGLSQPVLIAPEPPARVARKVAIAWDGSSVAAHAVRGAMPFLRRAETVEILTVGSDDVPGAASLDEYLALNDIKPVHCIIPKAPDETIGTVLLESAVARNDDLLVMGGYGHNYWRETLFGGVTAQIRWHAKLPVLLVH